MRLKKKKREARIEARVKAWAKEWEKLNSKRQKGYHKPGSAKHW